MADPRGPSNPQNWGQRLHSEAQITPFYTQIKQRNENFALLHLVYYFNFQLRYLGPKPLKTFSSLALLGYSFIKYFIFHSNIQGVDIETSYLVWWYIYTISRSFLIIKVKYGINFFYPSQDTVYNGKKIWCKLNLVPAKCQETMKDCALHLYGFDDKNKHWSGNERQLQLRTSD